MLRPALLSAFVLLAGCARSQEAHYVQTNTTSSPALNDSQLGEEDELAIGTWQSGLQDNQMVLEFGPVGAPARFTLTCDARRNLILQLPGAAPGGDLPNMLVTVGSETRRLAVVSAGTTTAVLRATLPGNDPFMRVLTGATARIFVRIGDSQPLVMPPSPLIVSYAQQCTSVGVQATTPDNSVEATGTVNVVATGNAVTNGQ
jgi:hypothetical protein